MRNFTHTARVIAGFDMDGVIIDHAPNKLALAESYAVRLRPEETHSEILPSKFARNEYLAFQQELYGDSDFALSAPLMDGASPVLNEMKEKGIPFFLISRRWNAETAIALLRRRGLWGDIFNEANTFFVRTPEDKNVVSVRMGVTHFFDDERNVLRAIPDVTNRFLFDTFRQFEDEKEFGRIFDWEMLRQKVFGE